MDEFEAIYNAVLATLPQGGVHWGRYEIAKACAANEAKWWRERLEMWLKAAGYKEQPLLRIEDERMAMLTGKVLGSTGAVTGGDAS